MYPILARYGSIFIYSFTVVIALGVVMAVVLTARLERRRTAPGWFDALLLVFVCALAGGRLGFVWGEWAYFQEQPAEIIQLWQGGFSYHGALLAGLAALALWAAFSAASFYAYAALFAPGLALVLISGWIACWFEGCAYGRKALPGPLAADLPDEFGVFALRYQTQLAGFFLALGAFLLILWLFKRLAPPALFWSALLSLSVAHLLPSFYRGDPLPALGPLRVDILLDLLLAAAALVALLMVQYRSNQQL